MAKQDDSSSEGIEMKSDMDPEDFIKNFKFANDDEEGNDDDDALDDQDQINPQNMRDGDPNMRDDDEE